MARALEAERSAVFTTLPSAYANAAKALGMKWTLVPVVQYDWLAAFKEPWLLPEHEEAVRAEDHQMP